METLGCQFEGLGAGHQERADSCKDIINDKNSKAEMAWASENDGGHQGEKNDGDRDKWTHSPSSTSSTGERETHFPTY